MIFEFIGLKLFLDVTNNIHGKPENFEFILEGPYKPLKFVFYWNHGK